MKKFLALLLLLSLSACGPDPYLRTLSKTDLEESLALGTEFLLNNQKPAGNFNYSYNFKTGALSEDDNQVRQAGALWGLSLLYAHEPSEELSAAIEKGLAFYGPNAYPEYPGDDDGKSGTLALLCLTLLDYLSAPEVPNREAHEAQLKVWLASLESIQNEDLLFYGKYEYLTGEGESSSSPYSDGEALLALSKAANHYDSELYFEKADAALNAMWSVYVDEALAEDPDSDDTKGFYQWSTMSLNELDHYQSTHDKETDVYSDKALRLANWMLDVHDVLNRSKNTAYAFEGLIAAYHLAELHGEKDEMRKLEEAIDNGLKKLTSWQVGHSLQNEFIAQTAASDALAQGGVTNADDEADLRIDVTQHQMHAVIMALEWIYRE